MSETTTPVTTEAPKLTRRQAVQQQFERYQHLVHQLHTQIGHWEPLIEQGLHQADEGLRLALATLDAQAPEWEPPRKPRTAPELEPSELVNIRATRQEVYAGVLPAVTGLTVKEISRNGKAITVTVPGTDTAYIVPRADLVAVADLVAEPPAPVELPVQF